MASNGAISLGFNTIVQRTRPDGFPDDIGRAMSLFKLEILECLQRCSDVLGSARRLRMLGQTPGSAHFLHDRRS
jgi:hypothetical protein